MLNPAVTIADSAVLGAASLVAVGEEVADRGKEGKRESWGRGGHLHPYGLPSPFFTNCIYYII